MKKKDIIQLVKKTIKEVGQYQVGNRQGPSGFSTSATAPAGEDPYTGKNEYPFSRRPKRTATGMMEDENLKEFTTMGQEGVYPRKEEPGDMFQQKEVEELLPNGMASRDDRAFQDRLKQHADWTEESGYNNTFVHIQYHDSFDREHSYRIHQSQNYNGNYKDFRNPKFTVLTITKKKEGKEEELGKYIVDTDAYLKDFAKLRNDGVLGKQVSENLAEEEVHGKEIVITAESLQKALTFIGDNLKNLSGSMLEKLKGILKLSNISDFPYNIKSLKSKLKQMTPEEAKTFGLELNKFHTDMKRKNIKEIGTIITTKGGDTSYIDAEPKTSQNMKADPNITGIDTVTGMKIKEEPNEGNAFGLAMRRAKEAGEDSFELDGETFKVEEMDMEMEPEMANDMNQDKFIDHEGRHAKMQLQKAAEYSVKLAQMMDDMTQLPSWVQSKITKASDYMSAVYHYLDYEMQGSNDNLMENVDKYKKRARLMESAWKDISPMFKQEKNDDTIIQHYITKGIAPEHVSELPRLVKSFRDKWNSIQKIQTDLKILDQEAEQLKQSTQPKAIAGMEDGNVGMEEEKQLASGLFNESKNKKK